MLAQAARPQTVEEVLAWHPHWDVWALVIFIGVGYWYLGRRIGPHVAPEGTPTLPARKTVLFYGGLAVLWAVSDWPIHDIGEGSLFSFHMLEHIGMALIAAPMLLMGTPTWMARYLLDRRRLLAVLKPLARPLPAIAIFNLALAGLHWPTIIESMVTNPYSHFAVHSVLFGSALLAWMPVLSPLPEIPKLSRPGQMMYLFVNSLVPTVPASFLVFGATPLYEIYASAPRLFGWSPLLDQGIAGILMKLGGGAILWGSITVIWFRWYQEQSRWDALEADLRSGSVSSPSS